MWSSALIAGFTFTALSIAQNCYYGPGAAYRGPDDLVPCNSTAEQSPCCRLGDVCLSGNACYNWATGNTYMYGCTDFNYEDATCPKKCNVNPADTPWIGLDYCGSESEDLTNTWTCLSPDSCGCEWNGSWALQILPKRSCQAMGSQAIVALYAPSTILPYISLPVTVGGSTGYYSTTTDSAGSWSVISTVIPNYTPTPWVQYATYDRNVPDTALAIYAGATPSPSTNSPAYIYTDATPPATAPVDSPTGGSSATSSEASSTASPTSSVNPYATTSPSTSSTPSSSPTAAASSGLSTGAKAGIGAGVAGGVCLAAAIGICWFLASRRRRRNAAIETQQSPPPQYPHHMPPMAPYQQAPPGGVTWVPVPSGTVPFYMQPGVANKDGPGVTSVPAYSPPRSPAPMSELSSDAQMTTHARSEVDANESVYSGPGANSPRLSATHYERSGSPRFHEGPV